VPITSVAVPVFGQNSAVDNGAYGTTAGIGKNLVYVVMVPEKAAMVFLEANDIRYW
jgi:hypothetical protein